MILPVLRGLLRLLPSSMQDRVRRIPRMIRGDAVELQRFYCSDEPDLRRGWDQIESRWHWFVDVVLRRLPERQEGAYFTHLPVLIAIGRDYPVRSVLELGAGEYSTLAFLNREAFPDLESITSYESDRDWYKRMSELTNDRRLDLRYVSGNMREVVTGLSLDRFDLILVDNATTRDERADTIRAIADMRLKSAIVVIHDFDIPVYRKESARFRGSYRFTALHPNTGVVWNGPGPCLKTISTLEAAVRNDPDALPMSDCEEHISWICSALGSIESK